MKTQGTELSLIFQAQQLACQWHSDAVDLPFCHLPNGLEYSPSVFFLITSLCKNTHYPGYLIRWRTVKWPECAITHWRQINLHFVIGEEGVPYREVYKGYRTETPARTYTCQVRCELNSHPCESAHRGWTSSTQGLLHGHHLGYLGEFEENEKC